METLYWVRRALAHTRFVPTPLYRLLVVGQLCSGIAQLMFGPPASVSENSSAVFDWIYGGISLFGGVVTIAALYLVDGSQRNAKNLHASLNLELLGLIAIQTAITINIIGVAYQLGTPVSGGSWFQIMFWCWAWFRMGAILKASRELAR